MLSHRDVQHPKLLSLTPSFPAHLQRVPGSLDGREMLKLSMRMEDGAFEVEAGQRVNAYLSVLIRGQETLSVEAAERGHVHASVVR